MPRSSPQGQSPSPAAAPDFDELYLASRRRLLLQAYALTGDLAASRTAVRDAFVAAAQRWHSVGRLADPEEWVRARTWSLAQRRHVVRRRSRDEGLEEPQAAVLRAVQQLPERQRRTLLLVHLAGLDPTDVGRELGLPPARVRLALARARAGVRRRAGLAGTPPGQDEEHDEVVTAALEQLDPVVEAVALPPAAHLQAEGRRRARRRVLGGVVAAVALTLAGGLFVVLPGSVGADPGAGTDSTTEVVQPVTEDQLLDVAEATTLDPAQTWRESGTSDNTEGDGINTVCQSSRFADPEGEGTLVRTFRSSGEPQRALLQTVEVSSSTEAAQQAYSTTLGWFAGCSAARLQLLDSYRVTGLGGRAEVLVLRLPVAGGARSYVVGLARSDRVTVSTVAQTSGGPAVAVPRAARLLERAVSRLCAADAAGSCPGTARVARVLPPPSGEARGTLAAADLPPIGGVDQPWVGTRPAPASGPEAATSCDDTRFRAAGATSARTRTYVVPGSDLPPRVGLTQTVGTFPGPARATQVVDGVVAAMAACEDDDLAATVGQEQVERGAFRGSTVALWRLDREVADDRSAGYWMGIARVGPHVTQVLFTPAGGADMDADTFRSVVLRARDRLFELTDGPR